jgi:O-antigen/teichoic acid export membrane protein
VGAPSVRGPIAASVVGKTVEMATLVLLATVVPRMLGPSDYGRFAVALTIVTLGSLALTLGGPALVTRYVPAAPPDDQLPLARAFGRRLAGETGVQLGVLSAIAVLIAVAIGVRIPWPETIAVAAGLFLNVAATIGLLVVLGLGGAAAWSARYPIQNAVLIALVLVLHPIAGSAGALAAIPLSAAVAVVFAAVVCAPLLARREGPSAALPDGATRFGRLQAGGAALTQVTHRGGVVVVAILAGSTVETGFAALAVGIAIGLTYAVVQTFTVALPPVLASEDDPERALTRIADGVLAVVAPACVIAALMLDRLVPAVFGSEYAGASSAFGPALAVVVLAPLTALAVNIASVRLRPEVVTASGAVSVVLFAAVALVVVDRWGATGATAATLTGVVGGAVVSLAMLCRDVPMRLAGMSFGLAALVVAVAAVA